MGASILPVDMSQWRRKVVLLQRKGERGRVREMVKFTFFSAIDGGYVLRCKIFHNGRYASEFAHGVGVA